ncbi:MAG TPA: efflux RND transporter periplasmic adaptor subunit [Candidatus Sulfotelmatobacter sp.]|jgi:multidrug efflux system membrane fusion protein|nr:efflux RND transporter periplasmic adaptor subunit [Candidatus Sulfotelmatobacter sp.]
MTRPTRCAAPVATLLAALCAAACGGDRAAVATTPPPAPVVVGQAVRRNVAVTLRSFGNVEPIAVVAVRSRVAGPIVQVHIADGADVTKGQTLFTIDPRPFQIALDKAVAALARDQALLTKADADVARYTSLVAKEYVTKEQFDAATSQAASLRATIQADQAAIEDAKLDLSYCTITAPIAGRVGSIAIKAGNLVKANDDPPLVTISQTRPIYVTFSVPEKSLSAIRARAAAGRLGVAARERGDTGPGHSGSLAFVDSSVDTATGTIRLKAAFPNDDLGLWPGQFVSVALELSEQPDAVVIPSSALQVGQQGTFVYVVSKDSVAEPKPVTVDRSLDGETVIASGLSGGETVVTDGQIRIVPGAKVAPQQKGPEPGASP